MLQSSAEIHPLTSFSTRKVEAESWAELYSEEQREAGIGMQRFLPGTVWDWWIGNQRICLSAVWDLISVCSCLDFYCDVHCYFSAGNQREAQTKKYLGRKKWALITWSYLCISKDLSHHSESHMFLEIIPPTPETGFYSHQKLLIF